MEGRNLNKASIGLIHAVDEHRHVGEELIETLLDMLHIVPGNALSLGE